MKLRPIKKEYMKVLERIQNSIPAEWANNITRKEMLAPRQAKLTRDIAAGIDNEDIDNSKITDKMREMARALVDSGEVSKLEKMVDVENKEITAKIDAFVDEEIYKATMRGELPKGKKFRNLKKKINGTRNNTRTN